MAVAGTGAAQGEHGRLGTEPARRGPDHLSDLRRREVLLVSGARLEDTPPAPCGARSPRYESYLGPLERGLDLLARPAFRSGQGRPTLPPDGQGVGGRRVFAPEPVRPSGGEG